MIVQLFAFSYVWLKGVDFMAIKTYSRNDKTQLSEHFNISEFHCKGEDCGCSETLHDPTLTAYLQQIRDHFGKPLKITSGYRCHKHNEAVGGSADSLHTKGQAADFVINGVMPLEIAQFAEQLGINGIGLYEDFVHIDTRSTKFYWYGHSEDKRTTFQEKKNKAVYIVTCRILGETGVHTLVFDGNISQQLQPIAGYHVAISMLATTQDAQFQIHSIGMDQAEILQVRKLEM